MAHASKKGWSAPSSQRAGHNVFQEREVGQIALPKKKPAGIEERGPSEGDDQSNFGIDLGPRPVETTPSATRRSLQQVDACKIDTAMWRGYELPEFFRLFETLQKHDRLKRVVFDEAHVMVDSSPLSFRKGMDNSRSIAKTDNPLRNPHVARTVAEAQLQGARIHGKKKVLIYCTSKAECDAVASQLKYETFYAKFKNVYTALFSTTMLRRSLHHPG
ncbi:hypothetical protein BDD12DRAFT_885282 [Trichophaea hybrida]|nr:hypothetical protein BDD12DRAFT_885282 [Trichophaea hybrida]